MLKIKCIVIDKTRSPFLREGEAFYLERLRHYAHVEWVEVKPVKIKKGRSEGSILDAEAKAIANRLDRTDFIVALDRAGEVFNSEGLAAWLNTMAVREPGRLTFIIGSPLGLSKGIIGSAGKALSLSRLTLTHEMTRLILLEQLYRGMTILRGEKYHR
jgi:23S rRNA (pseudouridine1915-N3)-methyltransferase